MQTVSKPQPNRRRSLASILAVLGIGLAQQACTHSAVDASTPAPLWDTEWRLESMNGHPVMAGSTATLGFYDVGQAGGNASCNRFFSTLKTENGQMQFGPIGATKMACPGEAMAQESRYLGALQKAQRYERQGDTLLIHAEGMDQPLRFTLAK